MRATRAELADRDDLETVALTSRLVVPAGRRFGVYAQVDHFEQRGGLGAGDDGEGEDGRSRTRWGIGLIVGVGGPPAAWGIREEPALLLRTIRPDRY